MTDPITIARAQVAIENGLIDALRSQQQADMDGTTVIVSRQACDEAAEFLPALYDDVKRLRADLRHVIDERDATFALMLARAEKAEAERDALRAALVEHNDLLRSASQIAKREGIDGEIASTNWDAYYNRVAMVLKRHHEIANTARQALKGQTND